MIILSENMGFRKVGPDNVLGRYIRKREMVPQASSGPPLLLEAGIKETMAYEFTKQITTAYLLREMSVVRDFMFSSVIPTKTPPECFCSSNS